MSSSSKHFSSSHQDHAHDPADDEPSRFQTRLIGSLIASQPASVDGFVAFGQPVGPSRWRWQLADLPPTERVPAALRQLTAPAGCTAIGLVSRATAHDLADPAAPGVPVIVAYAITRHNGSVSVLAYPEGEVIWCTSPVGELADAAEWIFAA